MVLRTRRRHDHRRRSYNYRHGTENTPPSLSPPVATTAATATAATATAATSTAAAAAVASPTRRSLRCRTRRSDATYPSNALDSWWRGSRPASLEVRTCTATVAAAATIPACLDHFATLAARSLPGLVFVTSRARSPPVRSPPSCPHALCHPCSSVRRFAASDAPPPPFRRCRLLPCETRPPSRGLGRIVVLSRPTLAGH